MPPRSKYTKEQIADAAFELVRSNGFKALKARSLAEKLGTSTAPIFTFFTSIEEIQNEVIKRANLLYNEYISRGLRQDPAFKCVGMKYIEFAKDEPELFKILNNNKGMTPDFLPAYDDNSPKVLELLEKSYGISNNGARKLYNHMSVYSFGLASLYSQKIYVFTTDRVSDMLSEVFSAMIEKIQSEESGLST